MSTGVHNVLGRHHRCPVCTLSMGSGGARKTRRLITRIAVDGVPPDLGPSGACLHRGARVPAGLVTPSRVTPDRGRAASDGRLCGATPGRWGPARVSQGPLGRWPTDRRAVPWRSPPRRDARVSPVRSAVGSVCRAVRAPSSGYLGSALGSFCRRRGKWRLTFAGYRYAQAPSTSACRACVFPVWVIAP
jgi:hypothetical protein